MSRVNLTARGVLAGELPLVAVEPTYRCPPSREKADASAK
jgi:hypothetical protein